MLHYTYPTNAVLTRVVAISQPIIVVILSTMDATLHLPYKCSPDTGCCYLAAYHCCYTLNHGCYTTPTLQMQSWHGSLLSCSLSPLLYSRPWKLHYTYPTYAVLTWVVAVSQSISVVILSTMEATLHLPYKCSPDMGRCCLAACHRCYTLDPGSCTCHTTGSCRNRELGHGRTRARTAYVYTPLSHPKVIQ